MADRLVNEIVTFCQSKCPDLIDEDIKFGRISFIAHSMGKSS